MDTYSSDSNGVYNQQTSGTQKTQIVNGDNNTQLKTTPYSSTGSEITHPYSAFGESLSAQLTPIIQGSFEYTVSNTELNTNTVVGSGTITQSNGMAVIRTGTTTGSTAQMISQRHLRYRSGEGGLLRFTALFTTGVSGTSVWEGLFDTAGSSADLKNGYVVGMSGTSFAIARFQNDVATITTQDNFSEDPLDGSGKSTMTIDTTKLNVFEIRFQYLGAGEIQFCIENPETGKFFVFHKIKYANQNTTPSVYNPNFHFGIRADNKATTSNVGVNVASYAFFVEGKTTYQEIHQPQFSSGTVTKTGVTSETALFTIRNKSTYAGQENFLSSLMEFISVGVNAASANNLATFRLVKNATLGGTPSWSDINTTDSTMEIDTAGTTVTGGKELFSLTLGRQYDREAQPIESLKIFLENNDSITFAVSSTNSASFQGSALWKELV